MGVPTELAVEHGQGPFALPLATAQDAQAVAVENIRLTLGLATGLGKRLGHGIVERLPEQIRARQATSGRGKHLGIAGIAIQPEGRVIVPWFQVAANPDWVAAPGVGGSARVADHGGVAPGQDQPGRKIVQQTMPELVGDAGVLGGREHVRQQGAQALHLADHCVQASDVDGVVSSQALEGRTVPEEVVGKMELHLAGAGVAPVHQFPGLWRSHHQSQRDHRVLMHAVVAADRPVQNSLRHNPEHVRLDGLAELGHGAGHGKAREVCENGALRTGVCPLPLGLHEGQQFGVVIAEGIKDVVIGLGADHGVVVLPDSVGEKANPAVPGHSFEGRSGKHARVAAVTTRAVVDDMAHMPLFLGDPVEHDRSLPRVPPISGQQIGASQGRYGRPHPAQMHSLGVFGEEVEVLAVAPHVGKAVVRELAPGGLAVREIVGGVPFLADRALDFPRMADRINAPGVEVIALLDRRAVHGAAMQLVDIVPAGDGGGQHECPQRFVGHLQPAPRPGEFPAQFPAAPFCLTDIAASRGHFGVCSAGPLRLPFGQFLP